MKVKFFELFLFLASIIGILIIWFLGIQIERQTPYDINPCQKDQYFRSRIISRSNYNKTVKLIAEYPIEVISFQQLDSKIVAGSEVLIYGSFDEYKGKLQFIAYSVKT